MRFSPIRFVGAEIHNGKDAAAAPYPATIQAALIGARRSPHWRADYDAERPLQFRNPGLELQDRSRPGLSHVINEHGIVFLPRQKIQGGPKMIQINGMAHVNLTVTSFPAAVEFYGQLLPFLGLQKVHESDKFVYWVGGRTGIGIQPCDPTYGTENFQQARVGLHHLCFRARERKDVDLTAAFLRDIGAHIVRGPQTGDWASGYYYVLFEDPDNIRLEICHVPGEGVLAKDAKFNPGSDY